MDEKITMAGVAVLVAGLLLLFDRPFRVGDRVSFNDVYGEIVSIGLRTVRLQTLDDNLVTPNVLQVSVPDSFLVSEKYYAPVMSKMMPST